MQESYRAKSCPLSYQTEHRLATKDAFLLLFLEMDQRSLKAFLERGTWKAEG